MLNKRIALSPGHFTVKHSIRLANKLKKQRLRQGSRTSKRRRLELKSARVSKYAARNVLEGQSYKTDIGLEEDLDLHDIDTQPLEVSPESSCLVYFDLVTTGLGRTSDIVQIAAVSEGRSLNIYMKPTKSITPDASAATGLKYERGEVTLNGKLCHLPKQKRD